MTTAVNLVLNDEATTPVAHTFTPRTISPEGAFFFENGQYRVGEAQVSVRSRISNGKYYKRVVLSVPATQVETVNGIQNPKVIWTDLVDVTFRFDEKSTTQTRKNIIGMFRGIFDPAKTMIRDVLVNDETING